MAKNIHPRHYMAINTFIKKRIAENESFDTNFMKNRIRALLDKNELTPEHAFALMKRIFSLEYTRFGITPNEEEITKKAIEELNR